ncbi:hypothetical protein L1049_027108 [Liquidambar formosana]|uniref:Uncharacterized protein n=1 Tax=Liquidambar formosana TaxID=63359 RepID=A0AAP0R3A1_LIQFO
MSLAICGEPFSLAIFLAIFLWRSNSLTKTREDKRTESPLASPPPSFPRAKMDSEGDGYFTNLLSKESTFEEQFNEQFTMDYSNGVRGSQQVPIEESPSTGKKKGGNFSVEEDELLISAWLNTPPILVGYTTTHTLLQFKF